MEYPKYEFYVVCQKINRPTDRDYVERFNIFQNWLVSEYTFKACKRYLRDKKKFTFDDLQEEIKGIIRWQEWSRYEYECSVGPAFPRSLDELKKIDCYWQAEPNMKVITEMCIERTKEFLKEKKDENITKHHIET